jgi:hypothetical protein
MRVVDTRSQRTASSLPMSTFSNRHCVISPTLGFGRNRDLAGL